MKLVGIDLGTTNTYMYGCAHAIAINGVQPAPAPVVIPPLSDNSGSISTVVMYEDDRPALAGNVAEQEFYANLALQPRRRLASQFKPEIARGDPSILRAMTDFLRLLREAAGDVIEPDSRILVGMPSLSREDFAIHLSRCFQAAGWPKPAFVRESDAALVSCLQSGVLDIDDMESKCLILDFGGGTCDFTSVANMDVLQNGGDLLYGGRLLDDLFFQLFCRQNREFATQAPTSPYGWYVHWIACKEQKESFSDFLRNSQADNKTDSDATEAGTTLHVVWFDAAGQRHDSYVHDYTRDKFLADAENYTASPEMLAILRDYEKRGGLSADARDLLAGRQIGLISWLRNILETVEDRGQVAKIVLTGGSSRWFFVPGLAKRVFPQAVCVPSSRSYEDIAFGLALYPILQASREKVQRLLNEKLNQFAGKAAEAVRSLVRQKTSGLIRLCSERIVAYDVMPVLLEASRESMTIGDLEKAFTQSIHEDQGLKDIAHQKSLELGAEIQRDLEFSFRQWLRENGVLLAPRFVFPARDIGEVFFRDLDIRLLFDELNVMKFTLNNVLPLLAAAGTGVAVAHTGEPVTTGISSALAYGVTWLGARAVPRFVARQKLPKFLLNEKFRKKIIRENREYIEKTLTHSLREIQRQLVLDAEDRIRGSLKAMLGRLNVLNQVRVQ